VNRSWLFNSLKINKYDMKSKTLDSIFKSKVIDLLKIDVEGLELDVLKGSVELLKSKSIKYIHYSHIFLKNKLK
jgi:FkbM family methyltransferase